MRPILLALLVAVDAFAGGGGRVVSQGRTFLAEVAVTGPERDQGLMYRQHLAADRCMFFLGRRDDRYPVRTRHGLIPLDVVWVDARGLVVDLAERVPPCPSAREDRCPLHGGTVVSRHYLEFSAGTIHRLGLHRGSQLGWDLTLDDGTRVKGGLPVPEGQRRGKRRR